ncbi:MAG: aldo/keto reductase [Gluconacetobacter diazotrophicus]|nr:aldo/keto reductase [Gluconacetobacter diazotrophicus]
MKKRLFDGTGRQVSEVGLGCWQLGGSDWGDLDDRTAFRVLDAAAEAGVTFFDTADVYGSGRSEELIGAFLKDRHGCNLFVATKLGRTAALYPDKYTAAGLREATEASLKRLRVDALDLTQLHCVPTEVLRKGEIFGWLRDLQTAGKIKAWGASVETADEALLCLEQDGLASLQVIFNLFRQKPAEAVLPKAKEKNVAIIVRLPLASGLLGGKMSKETHFAANDHRTYNRNGEKFNVGETFAGLPFETGVELVEELRRFAPEGRSMAQWTQRWILDHDAVTVVIPGASRPQQAGDNADVSALPPLPPELHDRLSAFYRERVAPHIRGPY